MNKDDRFTLLIILSVVLVICSAIAWGVYATNQYDKWYDSLSDEERAAYELQRQQEYESRIERYEVLSVHKYVRVETNNFGGIIDTDICYSFTYLCGGSLKEENGFEHLEHGLTKVTIGDSNMYIVNKNGETTRTLQLTKETIANLQMD